MPKPFASFDEALRWLDSHIDYERVVPTRRLLPSLDGVAAALKLLGSPQDSYPAIHITGTNGKGSTTAMITSLLSELGLLVGTYTSPNLHVVNERIACADQAISDDDLLDVLFRISLIEGEKEEPLTRFEILTVAALLYFADQAVDIGVIEVGMGGTWDSTNVVTGSVSVITNVSLDHVQVLGNSVIEIATDKSGIIKPGSTAILGLVSDDVARVIAAKCDAVGAAGLWRSGETFRASENRLALGGRVVNLTIPGQEFRDVVIPLHGAHQGENAAVALAAVSAFLGRAPSREVVDAGFGRVRVPGRCEVLGHLPLLVVDGAHNEAGAHSLGTALKDGFDVTGSMIAVLGMLEGRDPQELLEPLIDAGIGTFVCVEPDTPRAMSATVISDTCDSLGVASLVAPSIEDGVDRAVALAGEDGLVLATGSLYVVGDARLRLLEVVKQK